MKLEDFAPILVPERKLTEYLLSTSHPHGRHKAVFFRAVGFSAFRWRQLADALSELAAESDVAWTVETKFGRKFVVDGLLVTPDGRHPRVRTVWVLEHGTNIVTLVTAYPLGKEDDQRT